MKYLYINLLLSVFCIKPAISQEKGKFYKIDGRYWYQYIQSEKKIKIDSSTKVRRITEAGITRELIITEVDTIVEYETRMIPKYVPSYLFNGKKQFFGLFPRKFIKASLNQNDTKDSIHVRFWSLKEKDISKNQINGKFSNKCPKCDSIGFMAKSFQNCTICAIPIDPKDSDNFYFVFSKRSDLTTPPVRFQRFRYRSIQWGAASLPFKYRFDRKSKGIPSDISTDVNIGIFLGRRWGKTTFFNDRQKDPHDSGITASLFLSPTHFTLSEENISNKIIKKSNQFALSIGTGLWWSINKLEVGIFVGIDSPLSKEGAKWDYAHRPWVGMGLGYDIGMLKW